MAYSGASEDRPVVRVVAIVDVDCFGVQVIRKLYPELEDKPCALFSNRHPNAKILSLSYEAKELGVTKDMTIQEVIENYPQIQLRFQTEEIKDGNWFEFWSDRMIAAIPDYGSPIEKVSMDEFHMDLTEVIRYESIYDTYSEIPEAIVESHHQIIHLSDSPLRYTEWGRGATFVKMIMDKIYEETGLRCSAGISHNKLLAKIVCNLNKPNRIALLVSDSGRKSVFRYVPLIKCDGFGGKLGREVCEMISLEMPEICPFPDMCTLHVLSLPGKDFLTMVFGQETGTQLWDIAQGIDYRPVKHKPHIGTISAEKSYNRGLTRNRVSLNYRQYFIEIDAKTDIDILMADLKVLCDRLAQKLSQPSVDWINGNPGRIGRYGLLIEAYTPTGKTISIYNGLTKGFILTRGKGYTFDDYLEEEGLPMIEEDCIEPIIGIRVVVLSARKIKQSKRNKNF